MNSTQLKFWLIAIFLSVISTVQAQEPQNAAIQAAKSRQEKLKTFQADMRMSKTVMKTSLDQDLKNFQIGRSPSNQNPNIPTTPDKDLIQEYDIQIKSSNGMILCVDHQPIYDMTSHRFAESTKTECYNGIVLKKYQDFGNQPGNMATTGILDEKENKYYFRNYTYLPIMLSAFGYQNQWSALDLKDFQETMLQSVIRGKKCTEYLMQYDENSVFKMWIDPSTNYTIQRIERFSHGKLKMINDIEYQQYEAIKDWLPAKWTVISYDKQSKVEEKLTATVTNFDFQTPIPESVLDFQFPVGVRIGDNRVKKAYLLGENGVMTQVDGDNNPVGATAFMPGSSFFVRFKWELISIVAVVGIITVAWIYLKKRKITVQPPASSEI